MNLRASYRYQLADHKKSILIFYLVFVCAYLAMAICLAVFSAKYGIASTGSISGLEFTTTIFLFVSGLNAFKENFGMLTQNGVSRRSILVGRILVIATVSLFVALMDKIWYFAGLGLSKLFRDAIDCTMFVDMLYERSAVLSPFAFQMEALVFNFAMYMAVFSVGYFITVLFYRMNKAGKIIVGAGVPVFFLIILPIIDEQFFACAISTKFFTFAAKAFGLASGIPWCAVGSFFVLSAVFLAAAWLIMRRAPLHE